jgi:hypothetical protein
MTSTMQHKSQYLSALEMATSGAALPVCLSAFLVQSPDFDGSQQPWPACLERQRSLPAALPGCLPACRLKPGSLSGFAKLWAIPKWGAWAGGLNSAAGNSTNSVLTDFTGARRTAHNNAPGAYLQS